MHYRCPRGEKWWKGLERFSKEIIIENLPNLREKTRHPDPGITINTKNDDSKETHAKTQYNSIIKS